jgi:hypothetical protein
MSLAAVGYVALWERMMIRSDWDDLIKARAKERRLKAKAVALPTELENELTKVRALAPPPPSDDPIYDYLTSVYRLRCKVASSAELKSALKAHHKAHTPRALEQYAGVIIQMTAGDQISSNMKSKYVAVVEYAFANNVKPQKLKAFVKREGGFNKCVELRQKLRQTSEGPRKKKVAATD